MKKLLEFIIFLICVILGCASISIGVLTVFDPDVWHSDKVVPWVWLKHLYPQYKWEISVVSFIVAFIFLYSAFGPISKRLHQE